MTRDGLQHRAAPRTRMVRAAGKRGRQHGFTLMELLIVMVVIALGVSIAAPLVRGPTARQTVEAFARTIANDLRATRSRAIALNAARTFVVDVGERRLGGAAAGTARTIATPSRQLPPGIEIEATGASRDIDGGNVLKLTFYPDGSSSGARLVVRPSQAAAAATAIIDVEWLSGRVSTRFSGTGSDFGGGAR